MPEVGLEVGSILCNKEVQLYYSHRILRFQFAIGGGGVSKVPTLKTYVRT